MNRWTREIKIVSFWLIMAIVTSLFIGHLTILLLLLAVVLLIRQSLLINKLERNLSVGYLTDNKQAKGIWEEIYLHLYKIRKRQKQSKKKLSKMLERFHRSTDALPDAAVVLGKHDEIEWSNKAARQILGLRKKDRGQRIINLLRTPVFIQYLLSRDYKDPITIPSPLTDEALLQIKIVPYGAGQRLLLANDITHLRKLEQMRKDFAVNVSHELRTPLTVLKGYLETLKEQPAPRPFYTRCFEKMALQTERMQSLIDDLLLLTRLETREKHQDCVDIPKLLRQICHEGQIIGKNAQRIQLNIRCTDNLLGDEQELRSAFSNLLVNALKYSPADKPVIVTWSRRDKYLCLSVEDQGEGIAQADIPRITERFYRVDRNRSKKIQGTGLGLSIVKHVLVRHDAQLKIESQLGKGSHFYCLFPLSHRC